MSQLDSGLRKILSIPFIYDLYQTLVGAHKMRRIIVESYLKPVDGQAILDVGCGPGLLLRNIPRGVEYFGFDLNESYVTKARLNFGHRGTFLCQDVTKFVTDKKFDRIVIVGVLHHLEDNQINTLFSSLPKLLKEDGYAVMIENVYIDNQNPIAKFIISKDRGQNTRTIDGYLALCKKAFPQVQYEIRHDMLHIPFTSIVLKCFPKIPTAAAPF